MAAKLTAADLEWEASIHEALAAARARYPAGDPHLIFPLEGLADWYATRGELMRAKPSLHEAITIRIRTWGTKHPELAPALHLLSKIAEAEGKNDKANEYLHRATKCLLNAEPPRQVELAESWNFWAELKYRLGDVPRALRMCRKARTALQGRQLQYPMLTLRVQNNLGAIHLASGKSRLALKEFVRNYRLARKYYQPESPSLVTHYNNLSEALRRRGDIHRAERLLRRALKICRAAWGWNHALTASTASHLAGLWSHAGRWSAAEKLYNRVFQIRRKQNPLQHPDVLKTAHNIAELLCLQQAWLPAEKLLDRFLADLEQAAHSSPPVQALLRTRLARIYLATGRLATAERWLNEGWHEFHPQAAKHPLLVAELAFSLGMLHTQRRAQHKAEEFFQQALALQEQTLGAQHLDLAKTLVELGRLELGRSEAERADALFERARSLRETAWGPNHPLTAAALLDQAEAQGELQEWSRTQKLGQQALSILEQNPEEIPWLIAWACGVLSKSAFELDQHDAAEKFAVRELTLRQQTAGPDHADLAPVLLRLGRLQRMSEKIDQAVVSLRRGLAITEKARGQYDPDVIPLLEELCSLRATDGPTTELGPLVERYLKCHQRVFGHQSEELGAAQDQAAEWWRAAGDETRAQELNGRAVSLRDLSTHVFGDLM